MALQTSYTDTMRPAVAGQQATMTPASIISRTAMNAAGVAFGKAVAQDSAGDNCCHAFTTGDTEVLGIALRVRSLVAEGTQYAQYDSVAIMTEGDVWVVPAQNVVRGDPVYVRPSNGDFQKDNTNSAVLVPGARWEMTVTAPAVAKIRITPIR